MILLVHMIFGAAVGYKTYTLTNNIWLASLLALLSHYFLDIFPHVEYLKSAENLFQRIKKEKLRQYFWEVIKVILDFFLGLLCVFIFSNNQSLMYVFAMLAILPDGVTVINSFFSNAILRKHQKFHGDVLQYLTKSKEFPIFWRILTQVLALLVSTVMLRF